MRPLHKLTPGTQRGGQPRASRLVAYPLAACSADTRCSKTGVSAVRRATALVIVRSAEPHAMHDDGHLSGQGNGCFFDAATLLWESFQIFRRSSIRALSLRVCSPGATSRQYYSRMMPERTISLTGCEVCATTDPAQSAFHSRKHQRWR